MLWRFRERAFICTSSADSPFVLGNPVPPSPHAHTLILFLINDFKNQNKPLNQSAQFYAPSPLCLGEIVSANRWERVFRGICNFLCHLPLCVYRFYISFVYQISSCFLSPGFRICIAGLINGPALKGQRLGEPPDAGRVRSHQGTARRLL